MRWGAHVARDVVGLPWLDHWSRKDGFFTAYVLLVDAIRREQRLRMAHHPSSPSVVTCSSGVAIWSRRHVDEGDKVDETLGGDVERGDNLARQ